MFNNINMGLYTSSPVGINFDRHLLVLVLYQLFMLFVQIVLLNMVIAIMSESYNDVREVSELVALYERAKLVLAREHQLVRAAGRRGTQGKAAANMFPQWLHVLAPMEDQRNESTKKGDELTELRQVCIRMETRLEEIAAQLVR